MELEQKLVKRLEEATQSKENQQSQIKQYQNELQLLLSKLAKLQRPRDSLVELDKKISDLERSRTAMSMSLADERVILKQIHVLEKSKKVLQDYQQLDADIQICKSKLAEARSLEKQTHSSVEELQAALSKVQLASQLQCVPSELVTETMPCPQEKLGNVIGKQGQTLSKIMSQTKVTISVNRDSLGMTITGSKASVEQAKLQLDTIIRTVHQDWNIQQLPNGSGGHGSGSSAVTKDQFIHWIHYLTCKHVNVVETIRQHHPLAIMEIWKAKQEIHWIGLPEHLQKMQQELLERLQSLVTSQPLELTGRQLSILVGKKGSTIDSLESKYQISIHVPKATVSVSTTTSTTTTTSTASKKEKDKQNGTSTTTTTTSGTSGPKDLDTIPTTTAVLTGPTHAVQECLEEIEELMNDNREIMESIIIEPQLLKRILLADNGQLIKELQQTVNQQLQSQLLQDQEQDGGTLAVGGGGGGGDATNGSNTTTTTTTTTTANHCFLTFNKESSSSSSSSLPSSNNNNNNGPVELGVKAKQAIISSALETTEMAIQQLAKLLTVSLKVDPYAIPRMIGKNGETIKKLTTPKENSTASLFMDVDRDKETIFLGATTVADKDILVQEVQQLLEENSVIRVYPSTSSGSSGTDDNTVETLKAQYRELNKTPKSKQEISALAWLDFDEKNACFILRGKPDNLIQAKELLQDFLNHCILDQIPILAAEDQEAILSGGKKCTLMRLVEETGANLNLDRTNHVIVIRGNKEQVQHAKTKLNQFLHGDDETGYSVAKIQVTEQVVGTIIGKGGKTRQQLENKYDNAISIHISKSYKVSIRGPDGPVDDCRCEILKMVSSARVTQTIPVTNDQAKTLEKKDAIKRIQQETRANITIADGTATIKGLFYDVRDAVSLLNEQLSGVYITNVEIDPSQFSRVCNTVSRDLSHLERMQESSGAKVELDVAGGCIVVSATKRASVKKAKELVFGFLEFVLPGELARWKISKPLFTTVGSATFLAEIIAASSAGTAGGGGGGVKMYLDRDLGSIIITSRDVQKVQQTSAVLEEKIKEAEKLVYVLEVSPSEAWLLPLIIGKNGTRITVLQNESGCHFEVSKEARTVTVVGDSEEKVTTAREKLQAIVDQGRKENVFIPVPEKAMSAFVGKGGSHVKELSTQYKVEIQTSKKGGGSGGGAAAGTNKPTPTTPHTNIRISGDNEKNVDAAKQAIETWIAQWEASHASLEMKLENKLYIPVLIGNKGEVVNSIQQEFGCHIDVDKPSLMVTVRGGKDEATRELAMNKIKQIIQAEKSARRAAAAAAASVAAVAGTNDETKMDKENKNKNENENKVSP